ncbi:MAG: hypothetical protein OEY43_04880 [Gammaproteobacteria bacterium]|nr:hypothetical protein [Gammaproteobacteria bacterium]
MKVSAYIAASLFLLTVSVGCSAGAKAQLPWWQTIKLEPAVMVLDNLEPYDFNSDWVYASFISHSDIKAQIGEADYQAFIEAPFSFGKVIDLNGNGEDEAVRVGVYRDKDQGKGIFLAIFEEGRLVHVIDKSSSQDFSVLQLKNNEVRWYRCTTCSEYRKLVWDGSSYILE